ncbi:hypothetical protein CDV31_004788 [Fusarium ambrosium]|uniref:Uncharacterized protein n=1 Tax=Fusarium ambrosium TaxID=131363 RepID=A0A428UNI8_9HYPO|nr:hypothetical protein CDV31_004788 [Fusarium ambrosium]
MDPASLAFGVVSLVMQLMQTTTAIKNLIADYKSAARDLAVLSDKLDDIEAVCQSLEVVLSNFDEIRNPSEATLLNKLYKTIGDCRDKVSLTYDAVHKVTARRKNGRPSLATVGSLFLQHRTQIRQCNDDLDRSLSSLQLHMTTNIFAANMRPLGLPDKGYPSASTPSSEGGRSNETVSVPHRNRKFSSCKGNSDTRTTHWRWSWSTLGYLQTKKTLEKTPGFSETDSQKTEQDLSILAAVPMWNLYVKLSVRRGSLSPLSVSLHFPHIIDFAPGSSEIGDQLADALFYDDVGMVRDYFCEGLITPYSTVTWSLGLPADDETTFYGYSVLYCANNICRFLVDQTRDSLQRTPGHISLRPPLLHFDASFGLKQLTFDYVDLRGDSLTHDEFSTLLNNVSSAHDVKTYVDYCKQRLANQWEPFNLCVYSYVVCEFEELYSPRGNGLLNDWTLVLADILLSGVDVHTTTWLGKKSEERQGLSAFHRILSQASSTQEALEQCSLWLDLLERVGVDIEEYLDIEINHCTTTWHQKRTEKAAPRKILTIQEYRGRRMPCWVKIIDDTCPVRELLLEFPHFLDSGLRGVTLRTCTEYPLHRAWRECAAEIYPDGSPSWPFSCPVEQLTMGGLLGYEGADVHFQLYDDLELACYRKQHRFKRKQRRKLHKLHKLPKKRCLDRMPGAWVD